MKTSCSRRDFLKLAGLGVAGAALAPRPGQAAAAGGKRPNILFIASDDMRPQLGCYGDTVVKSPNLDALAARGMVFKRAFCQQALCSPSRISLLSGRHPWTTQIYQIGPPLRSTLPDIVTLPQLFKNNGWFTRSLGKIFHIGIDDAASWSVPSWTSKTMRYDPDNVAKVKAAADKLRAAGREIPQKGQGAPQFAGAAFSAPDCADDALTDGDITNKAIAELREFAQKPEQPFFLGVGFVNPHVPWVAPKRYYDFYPLADLKLPANRYVPKNAPAYAAKSGDDFYWYSNVPKDRVISDDFGRRCLQGYLAAISYVDACIGRVLAELDKLGLRENTIIAFWGDHGYYMGEHSWWGGKHNNYEGATHAPLIVAAPGMKAAGKPTEALVEFVDIFPSLAELAHLPLPDGLEGKSFAPLLDDPKLPWKAVAISEYPKGGHQGTAMRTDRYRYVEWRDKKGQPVDCELYDHASDPQENENIAGQPEQAKLIKELAAQLAACRQRKRSM
jgi:arylsulfatase A-like enzyme